MALTTRTYILKTDIHNKLNNLINYLKTLEKVAIAYSNGVDSTFLLDVAVEALGKENVLAITIASNLIPQNEVSEAVSFCKSKDINHIILNVDELSIEGFASNPPDRCYICKKNLFSKIIKTANECGITYVLEGSNIDDMGDYRPGLKAITELGIKSPLKDNNLSKADIRILSKMRLLQTASKPSYACLASRFVYGENITPEKLKMVEQAENFLISKGFSQMRVRIHGNSNYLARIEVPAEDIDKLLSSELRNEIESNFKNYGFSYVTIDIKGYRTGSMNEIL